jgi:hypothetical protein
LAFLSSGKEDAATTAGINIDLKSNFALNFFFENGCRFGGAAIKIFRAFLNAFAARIS